MSRIELRKITGDSLQIDIFSAESFRQLGQYLPTAYKDKADTWALYVDGVMKGGFVLARGETMRSTHLIPKERVPAPVDDLGEAAQIWITRDLATSTIAWRLWWKLRTEVVQSSCRYVLIPWSTRNKGLGRFYQNVGAEVVFQGRPKGELPSSELVVGCLDTRVLRWPRVLPLFLMIT